MRTIAGRLAALGLGFVAFTSNVHALVPLQGVQRLSSGQSVNCILTTEGRVKCWGYNGDFRAGAPSGTYVLLPTEVAGLGAGNLRVAVGYAHACVVTSSGGVKCWGSNQYGQLGDGTKVTRAQPQEVTGLSSGAIDVAVGNQISCAILAGGAVKCWGTGAVGDNTSSERLAPVDVVGLATGAVAIGAGWSHACALTTDGQVKCWGENGAGQLGDATYTYRLTPVLASGIPSGATLLSVGSSHTCAVVAGGAKCWGYDNRGQLGAGTTGNRNIPTDVVGLASGVTSISAGNEHSCAARGDGSAACWGYNGVGQLGDSTRVQRLSPSGVVNMSSATAVAAGGGHSCALLADSRVQCWGDGGAGALGHGAYYLQPLPVDVIGLTSGTSVISAGGYHSCAVRTNGTVQCWGFNDLGALGDGTTTTRLEPVTVGGLPGGASFVSAGTYFTCAISAGGGAKCWGRNLEGQLGAGAIGNQSFPVDVSGLGSGITAISSYGFSTCALQSGAVRCWGRNSTGQLGDNSTTQRNTPVTPVGLVSSVSFVKMGGQHACAILVDGSMRCWGRNADGQLGDGTNTQRLTPVGVSGGFSTGGASAMSLGAQHTCVLTGSGGVKCWGWNASGQLGDGTTTNRNVPTDVLGLSSGVAAIAAGSANTCALLNTGVVKCWGQGIIPNTSSLSPVEIPSLAGVTALSQSGGAHSCAIFPGGRAKCWGDNNEGAVGDGKGTRRAYPGDVLMIDDDPDPFGFGPALNDVELAATLTSDPVVVASVEVPVPISVTGGEYSVGCTATYTNAAGSISNNDSVCVRHVSAAAPNTSVNTTLTVGGRSATFTSTTGKASVTVVVRPSRTAAVSGQELTFTASLGSAYGSPSGMVTFKDGSTVIGSSSVSAGTASITTAAASTTGPHVIVAEYEGSIDHRATPSPGFALRIGAGRDLSGDGRADLTWMDANGQIAAWLMNGSVVESSGILLGPSTGWSIRSADADLNGDGLADLLWVNVDGSVAVWLMNGLTPSASGILIGPGTGWSVAHVADLDGDGRSDILWRHTDGSVGTWLMNGLTPAGSTLFLGAGTPWSPTHTGDLNGDGRADIVWAHTDGTVAAWTMNGTAFLGGELLFGGGTGWSVTHVADLSGEGFADLVWKHTDGSAAVWIMNGLVPGATGVILGAGTGWSVILVDDLDGDGKRDLIWENVDGRVSAWLMDGVNYTATALLLDIPDGSMVTHARDLNGDGRADLIWQHPDGSVSVRIMNGLATTSSTVIFGGGSGWVVAP